LNDGGAGVDGRSYGGASEQEASERAAMQPTIARANAK
jgi:hypothetical protein